MKKSDTNILTFFSLMRAGLWEKKVSLLPLDNVNFEKIYRLAEEQNVVGLIAAGLEYVKDVRAPQEIALTIVGRTLQLEQQNQAMNSFISELVEKMRRADIYTLLLKGQGIAQCYERPLWRACGDVDLFLSDNNFQKAIPLLVPLASYHEPIRSDMRNFEMSINSWYVELHGTLHCGLSMKMDRHLDSIKNEIFYGGKVRSWMNGKTQIFLPAIECDIIIVFTHFLKHFYKGGLGLRQICDWCRLLWTFRDKIDQEKLEKKLREIGLISEWKAFGAFAVDYLGMPIDAFPLYNDSNRWKKKADRICAFILEVGNFGHNIDSSYYEKYPFLVRKVFSFGRRCNDLICHASIFPLDSIRFFVGIVFNGIKFVLRGE